MHFSRRNLFGLSAIAAAMVLPGCGLVTRSGGTITVNLANAQSEAKTIYTALTAFVTELADTVPESTRAKIEAAYAALGTEVTTFAELPDGNSTIPEAAQAIINAVQSLIALLPIPAVTASAISAGLLLISGLIAGLSSMTIPAPAAALTGVAAAPVVAGPIPVPLG